MCCLKQNNKIKLKVCIDIFIQEHRSISRKLQRKNNRAEHHLNFPNINKSCDLSTMIKTRTPILVE